MVMATKVIETKNMEMKISIVAGNLEYEMSSITEALMIRILAILEFFFRVTPIAMILVKKFNYRDFTGTIIIIKVNNGCLVNLFLTQLSWLSRICYIQMNNNTLVSSIGPN